MAPNRIEETVNAFSGGTVRLTRRRFVGTIAAAAAALAAPSCLLTSSKSSGLKPNIVYIMADDMGYGDPCCYNDESKVPTPHLDRLASEGLRFTDAHSGSAVCTPTRYGILTGRYAWRTRLKSGVLWGYSPPLIEPERLTVPALLKRKGYWTGCVGKWHLGLGLKTRDGKPAEASGSNVDFTEPISGGPLVLGFDAFFGISASLDMPPYAYIENDRFTAIPTKTTKEGGRLGLTAEGFKCVDVLPELTERAVSFVDGCVRESPERPFFLYFPLTAPHTPVVPADFVAGWSRAGRYGDFTAQVDWTVGEIMNALDRNGISENTLVIVTSDNGSTMLPMVEFDHLPNGRLRGRKSDVWDGGHRIPFIARWPAVIAPGGTTGETVCLTDLMATCADIIGESLPGCAGEDSFSFLPILEGRRLEKPIREATVHHSIDGMFAIRRGPWKLVLGRGSGGWSSRGIEYGEDEPPGQLYNMAEDFAERCNLYLERPDIVADLKDLLEKYKREGRSTPRERT